jgi:hypothetical protein
VRLLVGLLSLAVLFLAAARWQRRWTAAARAESAAARGATVVAEGQPAEGWSRVIVGRPSGGEPFPRPSDAPAPRPARPAAPPPAVPAGPAGSTPNPAAAAPQRVLLTVQAGQNLASICRERYGTSRSEVVDAVARRNRLASPDLVREGQKLELPPLEELLPKR